MNPPHMIRRRRLAAGALLGWGALWLVPWQPWLQAWPWLRTVLALGLFMVPGMALHACLTRGAPTRVSARVAYGFALSVLATGLFGLVACLSHLSFTFVLAALWTLGLLVPGLMALPDPAATHAGDDDHPGGDAMTWLDWLEGAAVLAIAARLAFAPAGGTDDFTHVARITQFQSGAPLGFGSLAFGDAVQIPPRYWFAYWPLCEAVLSALSGLHSLELTTNYLGPLLAPLGFVSLFHVARSLGLSRRLGIATLAAQLIALVMLGNPWQPGLTFLNRVTEDKVMAAYILTPTCIAAAANYFAAAATRARAGLALALLVPGAIALTHATAFGIAYLSTMAYAGMELLAGAPRGRVMRLMLGATVLVATLASLRFVQHPSMTQIHFTVASADRAGALRPWRRERLWISDDDLHYAVSRKVLPPAARLVGGAALFLACLGLRRQRVARYVAGSLVLVGLTLVPETAEPLGLTVTPFHLDRVSWQAPFGLALLIAASGLIAAARAWVLPRVPSAMRLMHPGAAVACELALLGVLVAALSLTGVRRGLWSLNYPEEWRTTIHTESELASGTLECRRTYADLIALGRLIDERAPRGALVVADSTTNDLVPSVSSSARLLLFRSVQQTVLHGSMSESEAADRSAALERLFNRATPAAERLSILTRYRVDYVVQCGSGQWPEQFALAYPDQIERVARAGELELYRVLSSPARPLGR